MLTSGSMIAGPMALLRPDAGTDGSFAPMSGWRGMRPSVTAVAGRIREKLKPAFQKS
ncbi:MAG: hypothetical protein CJBNEKGG_01741 [Prosthecobacter sp.]|nr:hypothetical protein [Prosthecobacter sp.]